MTAADKAQLRRQLRARRRALSAQQQARAAQRVVAQLAKIPAYRNARHIACYLENDGEPGTRPLRRDSQRRGIACYLPVVHAQAGQFTMHFHRYRPGQTLRRNRFGINEPNALRSPAIAADALDIVLMPLVGFDRAGRRLGMGGGFYDRALAFVRRRPAPARRPLLIGVAHSCQELSQLPHAPWDVPLDMIVTERELIRPRR